MQTSCTPLPLLLLFLLFSPCQGARFGAQICLDGSSLDLWGSNSYREVDPANQGPRYSPTTFTPPDDVPLSCVAVGGFSTAVKNSNGTWWMFGRNDQGELGLGNTNNNYSPARLPQMGGSAVMNVSLGLYHSMFLTAAGQVWTVGYNALGQLGLGTTVSTQFVPGLVSFSGSVSIQILVTGYYVSGVVLSNGSAFAWGGGLYGQLGYGTPGGLKTVPTLVALPNVQNMNLAYLNSGWITTSGQGYVAGDYSNGQLGLGADQTTGIFVPTQLVPPNNQSVTGFAFGYTHAAIGTATAWYVFGNNQFYQLGLGNVTGIVYTPTLLMPPDGAPYFTQMSFGEYTSAGSSSYGNFYTWGFNYDGEVGNGNTVNQATPQQLIVAEAIDQIAMGFLHGAILRAGTHTPTVTLTPTAVVCSASALSFATTVVSINTEGSCTFTLTGSSGSSIWFTRYVAFTLRALGPKGTVRIKLATYCPTAVTRNTTCTWEYGFGSIGAENLLTLGSTPTVTMASATAATMVTITGSHTFDPAAPEFAGSFQMAYQATALLLGLTCGLTALGAFAFCALALWYQRRRAVRTREDFWNANGRLKGSSLPFAIVTGLFLLLVGIVWIVISALGANPVSLIIRLLIAGTIVAVVGLLVAIGSFLWAMRDPHRMRCPGCEEPVTQWRFSGTYLPPDEESTGPFRKAHTAHVRCLVCRRPVIVDRWPASPALRPYHAVCWESHCSKCTTDPVEWANWWDAQGSEITTEELVHLLAAAVEAGSEGIVGRLMEVDPSLPCLPISQKGGRSALHLAARSGSLPLLQLVLKSQPYVLDPVCPFEPDAPQSLSIQGAEKSENDLYVYQPQVLYNDFPFFVGHSGGKYVYYYKPPTDPTKKAYTEGWCLSAHLGSGAPSYRLPIVEAMTKHHVAPEFPREAPNGRAPSPKRRVLQRVQNWLERRHRTPSMSQLNDGRSAGDGDDTDGGGGGGGGGMRGAHSLTNATVTAPRIEELFVAPVRLAEDLRIDWVPHAQSLFLEAVASGNEATIRHVAKLYQDQDPSCHWWEYDACYGLWMAFTPDQQAKICRTVRKGFPSVQFTTEDDQMILNFMDLRYTATSIANPSHQTIAPFRHRMRTIVQYRDRAKNVFGVTSIFERVKNWEGAFIVFTPTHAAATAMDNVSNLAFLLREHIADYSLWAPPSLPGTSAELQRSFLHDAFIRSVTEEITTVLGDDSWKTVGMMNRRRSSVTRIAAHNVRGETDSGIGNRLTDGLQAPQTNAEVAFYTPEYTSTTWTLPFCSRLPENAVGYNFPGESLLKLVEDTIMKVHELRRQGHPLNPRNSVALFVYTYELISTGELQDQIYGSLNAAMRTRDERAIAFWRPFIWELDQALMALPPFVGKSYRGINCVMDPKVYATSRRICWPSFSSASQNRTVAEEFAKGDTGTLFFLQSSNAKAIRTVSRFPDEEEVLFAPNSIFEITSTMTSSSDIGQFYGKVDNIAMKQCGGLHVPGVKPRPVGHTTMLIHLPTGLTPVVVDTLALVQSGGIQSLDLVEEREDGISSHVVISEDPSSPFAPPPGLHLLRAPPTLRARDVTPTHLLRLDDTIPDPVRVTTPIPEEDLFVPLSELRPPPLPLTRSPSSRSLTPKTDTEPATDAGLMPPPRPPPPPPPQLITKDKPPLKKAKSPKQRPKSPAAIRAPGLSERTAMA